MTEAQVQAAGAELAPPADLPARCDAVLLHAPGGRTLVDADWLRRCRDGLILVNTARADLVDEPALTAALRTGRLGAYAADTLAGESRATDSPLLAADLADRVVLTPHLGAQTTEAWTGWAHWRSPTSSPSSPGWPRRTPSSQGGGRDRCRARPGQLAFIGQPSGPARRAQRPARHGIS